MLNSEHVIFTDIDKNSKQVILLFSRVDKSFTQITSSRYKGSKIEFCLNGDDLITGDFSYPTIENGSTIEKIPMTNNVNFKKKIRLYESQSRDLGNILCDKGSLYFVKTYNENTRLDYLDTDIAKLNINSKKIRKMSDLKRVTQIIKMDGRILIPFRKEIYVIKGQSTSLDDSIEGLVEEKK
jgi:hypothetical protein